MAGHELDRILQGLGLHRQNNSIRSPTSTMKPNVVVYSSNSTKVKIAINWREPSSTESEANSASDIMKDRRRSSSGALGLGRKHHRPLEPLSYINAALQQLDPDCYHIATNGFARAFVEAARVAIGCSAYFGDFYKRKRALGKKPSLACV